MGALPNEHVLLKTSRVPYALQIHWRGSLVFRSGANQMPGGGGRGGGESFFVNEICVVLHLRFCSVLPLAFCFLAGAVFFSFSSAAFCFLYSALCFVLAACSLLLPAVCS